MWINCDLSIISSGEIVQKLLLNLLEINYLRHKFDTIK